MAHYYTLKFLHIYIFGVILAILDPDPANQHQCRLQNHVGTQHWSPVMKRLDQSYLHPLEPGSPRWEASTLTKILLASFLPTIQNLYTILCYLWMFLNMKGKMDYRFTSWEEEGREFSKGMQFCINFE